MHGKPIREFRREDIRQGDIVLIPFQLPDLKGRKPKPRPALVVSTDRHNDFRKSVVLLPLTSRIPHRLSDDEYLLSQEDLRCARLHKTSIVLIGVVMTVDKDSILNRMGKLQLKTVEKIIHKLTTMILAGP